MQNLLWPNGVFFRQQRPDLLAGKPSRQMLPSEFLPRPDPDLADVRTQDRAKLHTLLVHKVPTYLRDTVASNARLKSIQMPEVVRMKDHVEACRLLYEMVQSPEMLQLVFLRVLQHTVGVMYDAEGVGDMFEAALWTSPTLQPQST